MSVGIDMNTVCVLPGRKKALKSASLDLTKQQYMQIFTKPIHNALIDRYYLGFKTSPLNCLSH